MTCMICSRGACDCKVQHESHSTDWDLRCGEELEMARMATHNLSTLQARQFRKLATSGTATVYVPPKHPLLNVDLSLASLTARYVAEKTRDGDWGQPFLEQVVHVTGEFLGHVGNLPVIEVSRPHIHSFKQMLLAPTGEPDWRGRIYPKKSKATTNRYLGILTSFFKWAVVSGYCDINPCEGQRCSVKGSARDERKAFSDEEMDRIFRPGDHFRTTSLRKGLAHYWIPLIMRYSGMRPEEIAQLRHGDFAPYYAPGVIMSSPPEGLCFDLRSPGLNIKTEAGRRLVPVHPKLLEGIEALRGQCAMRYSKAWGDFPDRKEFRLFPELATQMEDALGVRYAARPSRWFNEIWLRQYCNIKDPKKTLYSIRHTAITRMAQAGHSELIISQLVGHCPPRGETFGRYAKGCSMAQLVEAVSALY